MASREKFEQIALPYLDTVFRAATALCGNRTEAEDLTQATMFKALRAFDRFTEGTNCRAWLLHILRNTFRDTLRHRAVTGPSGPLPESLPAASSGPAVPPKAEEPPRLREDVLEAFEDEQVIAALRKLPPDQLMALYLSDVEQLSHTEVAEALDVAVGTVKSRTCRARRQLAEVLREHARDLGLSGTKR